MTAARQQPNAPHTNPKALQEGTWDYAAVHRTLDTEPHRSGGVTMNHTEAELHEHYASNARACGHADDCLKVTLPVNWPTLWGRPLCTCGRGEPWIHPAYRAAEPLTDADRLALRELRTRTEVGRMHDDLAVEMAKGDQVR